MITLLIVLDVLLANLTPYTLHTIIWGIPLTKSFSPLLIYFLILSFFDYRYLFNLVIVYLLFLLNKKINRIFREKTTTYLIKVILFYLIYLNFLELVKLLW